MAGKPAAEGFLTKFRKFREIIKANGGIRGSIYTLYRTDELKKGELVGTDKFGNKYYQNNEHFMARNKWVHYSDQFGMDYDGSQVPPEWHRWLSDMTDTPPSVQPLTEHKWQKPHQENLTKTNRKYVPYSTTPQKIEAWDPNKPQQNNP